MSQWGVAGVLAIIITVIVQSVLALIIHRDFVSAWQQFWLVLVIIAVVLWVVVALVARAVTMYWDNAP
jgi:hypothetical protein